MAKYYEPYDDTFIFTRLLMKEFEQFKDCTVCEVGIGSGYITKALAKKHPSNLYIGVDINKEVPVSSKEYSLCFSSLLRNINQDKIDVVFFNPPYVETKTSGFDDIRASYSGGLYGTEIINQFIEELTCKRFYLLIIAVNKPDLIIKTLKLKYKTVKIVDYCAIRGEEIYIVYGEDL